VERERWAQSQFFLRLGGLRCNVSKPVILCKFSVEKLAELLVKYKGLDSREAYGVRRIPALSLAFASAKTFAQSLSKAPEYGALQTLREFGCGSAALWLCVETCHFRVCFEIGD
jgi:hypothetical protein